MDTFLIWAHRGASSLAPENTMAAFKAAEAAGAQGLELDVHLSRDGVPVVLHDETLERTTDGRGAVKRFRLRELQQLDAGSWYGPEFAGESLPTLSDVLSWAEDRMLINIEIKTASAATAVLELLADFPRARILVSSFNHRLLGKLAQLAPELALGVLVDSPFWRLALKRAVRCGARSLHPRQDLVSRAMMQACRRQGLAVYPWTVDDPGRLSTLLRMGADGVFTNDPGSTLAEAEALGEI